MQKLMRDYKAMAILSGVLTAIAVDYINFLAGWICFVPLFIVLQKLTAKESFKAGFIFGATVSLASFYWMVNGAERFTGSDTIYGYTVFFSASLFMSMYFAVINYGYSILKLNNDTRFSFLMNGLLIASIYVIGEALMMYVMQTLPWFAFHSGYSLMDNTYAIQPAAIFGIHGLSFFVVFVNYLVADFVTRRRTIKFAIFVSAVFIYMLSGFFMFKNFKGRSENKPITSTFKSKYCSRNQME